MMKPYEINVIGPLLILFYTVPVGMSECSGPQMTNTKDCQRVGSIGKTFPGFETRLDTTAAKATTIKAKLNQEDKDKVGVLGDPGEICMRGRHVMMGYYGQSNVMM